jgi:HJR/Mrr/RecB family endonuclease
MSNEVCQSRRRAATSSVPSVIIDAWMQHPTLRMVGSPIFASLRRWIGEELPTEEIPIDLTIAAMDVAGVSKATLSAWSSPRYGEMISNAEVAGWVAEHPDRFVGLASADLDTPMESVRELRRRVKDDGFKGLRMLPWLWDAAPTDRRYYPLYAECVELGVPFCTQVGHAGPLMPSEPGRPIPYIDQIAIDFPELVIVCGHAGIQSGNVTDSITLVKMLSEQEPFYPSIPKLQSEIKRLEQRHLLNSELSINFAKVEDLSGIEFENLLLDKFVSLGFKVEPTPKTGDYGADLIVENNDGTRIIFQCKRFKSKVNLKAVQEVVGAMGHYAGDYGVVITNNTFLNSAVKLAESHDIELWDGDKLISFLAGDLSFSEILS